jgi:hypothetical protein
MRSWSLTVALVGPHSLAALAAGCGDGTSPAEPPDAAGDVLGHRTVRWQSSDPTVVTAEAL